MNTTQKKRLMLSLILPLAVLCIRFGPLLFGLEWRVPYRGVLTVAASVVLLLWGVVWIILTRDSLRFFLSIPAVALAFCLIFSQVLFPPSERLVEVGGMAYVRENTDPGSMAEVRLYPYVNEVFRNLIPDYDALHKSLHPEP